MQDNKIPWRLASKVQADQAFHHPHSVRILPEASISQTNSLTGNMPPFPGGGGPINFPRTSSILCDGSLSIHILISLAPNMPGGRGMPFPPFPPNANASSPTGGPPPPGGMPFPPPPGGGMPDFSRFPPPGFPPPQGGGPPGGPSPGGQSGFPPPGGPPGFSTGGGAPGQQ
jgi:U1 small nuclear ribonucleoprotein C